MGAKFVTPTNSYLRSYTTIVHSDRSPYIPQIVLPDKGNIFIQLFVVQRECEDLRNQLETSRCQLQSKSLEVADLSFSLDEEKYKNSLSQSERSTNSSFRAVYEESNSLDRKSMSNSLNGTSPLDGTLSPINGTIYHSANSTLNDTIDDVFTK